MGICNFVDPSLDSVWVDSHRQKEKVHDLVQRNIAAGTWIEYECYDDLYKAQGWAVIQIVEVYLDASGAGNRSWVARAKHIWATDQYYAWWAKKNLSSDHMHCTTFARATWGVVASIGVGAS